MSLPSDISNIIQQYTKYNIANGNLAWEEKCHATFRVNDCQIFGEHLLELNRRQRTITLFHVMNGKFEQKLRYKTRNQHVDKCFLFEKCLLIRYGHSDVVENTDHKLGSISLVDLNGVHICDWDVCENGFDDLLYYSIIDAKFNGTSGEILLLVHFFSCDETKVGIQKFSNNGVFLSFFDCCDFESGSITSCRCEGFCVDQESNVYVHSPMQTHGYFIDMYDQSGVFVGRIEYKTDFIVLGTHCTPVGSFLICEVDENNLDDDNIIIPPMRSMINQFDMKWKNGREEVTSVTRFRECQQCHTLEFQRQIYDSRSSSVLLFHVEKDGNIRVFETNESTSFLKCLN